jgi:catechol 2,3-dioxygenase-like lactoylglutathione lyase family enzyme
VTEQLTQPVATDTPFAYAQNCVISVNVSDLERSLAWYRDALGFPEVYRMADYGWAEVATAIKGVSIGLGQTEEIKHGGTVPTFGVENIHAAKAHIEAKGGSFESEPYDIADQVTLVTFYDPDGNPFMLAQVHDTDKAARGD